MPSNEKETCPIMTSVIAISIVGAIMASCLFWFNRIEPKQPLRIFTFQCQDGHIRDYFYTRRDLVYEEIECEKYNWR